MSANWPSRDSVNKPERPSREDEKKFSRNHNMLPGKMLYLGSYKHVHVSAELFPRPIVPLPESATRSIIKAATRNASSSRFVHQEASEIVANGKSWANVSATVLEFNRRGEKPTIHRAAPDSLSSA